MTQLTEKGIVHGYLLGERDWDVTMNANLRRLSAMGLDQWAVIPTEPRTLDVHLVGGWVHNGAAYVRMADTDISLPNNTTRFIERTALGVVFVVAGAFTPARIPIARVVTLGGVVTLIEDARPHMIGPAGADGPQGIPGADGADGADGVDGAPGAPGAAGAVGPAGPAGAAGAAGAVGPAGPAGAAGVFPDEKTAFGAANVDDEEFEAALVASGWTIETALTAPNAAVVNGTFCPSRIQVSFANVVGDIYSATRPLASSMVGDISVTWDCSGVFDLNYKSIECGFRSSAAGAAVAMSGAFGHVNDIVMLRRKYSNVGTSTFVDQANELFMTGLTGPKKDPRRYFMHLQRVAGSWTLWYSHTGVAWKRIGAATADAFVVTHLWFKIAGFGAAVPYYLAMHWIRINRFFL